MHHQIRAVLCLVLVLSLLGCSVVSAASVVGHPLTKRSFFDIQCKGVYDKSIFARLDRICEDCYNLFREAQLHSLCRSKCFTSKYFKGCVEALLLKEEEAKLSHMVEFLGKRKRGDDGNVEIFDVPENF